MGHIHAFQAPAELFEHISELPSPEAVVVNLDLKGTPNGFQTAETIRKLRPEINPERFCFTSGRKKQYIAITPNEFRDNVILDKGNWAIEDLETALNAAINSAGGV